MRRLLLLLPALTLAACAADPTGPGIATVDGSAAPSAAASPADGGDGDPAKFAQCMREQGLTWWKDPDPGERGFAIHIPKGVDEAQVNKAMQACKEFMPNGGEMPKLDPAQAEQLRKYAKCMRENGVPGFPDPGADGGIKLDTRNGIDPQSAAFKNAEQKCTSLRPQPRERGNTESGEGA